MPKKNKYCLFLAAAILVGCVSKKIKNNPVSFMQIEKLSLNATKTETTKILGGPGEVLHSEEGDIWSFNTYDGTSQRATVDFDTQDRVFAKTILPLSSDAESRVDFVLKSVFSKIQFRNVEFPMCGRDHSSPDALYVNLEKGISIQYSKFRRETIAITWEKPQVLERDIEAIQKCRK